MKTEECPTYHKILDTAVQIILSGGVEALTIRRVAADASVNIAAVNYHFQSKDNLIDAAIVHISEPILDEVRDLSQSGLPPRKRLRGYLDICASHVQKFPHSLLRTFAAGQRPVVNTSSIMEIKKYCFNEIIKTLKELIPESDSIRISVTAVQLFYAVAIPPLLFPYHTKTLKHMELKLPPLEKQLDILMENFLGPEPK